MRVAMLGSFPLDPDRIPGGVEAVIKNLMVPLARIEGLELHLVTCVQGLHQSRTTSYRGVTVHYLPGQSYLGHLTDHFLEQRALRRKLQELEPDLVHAHGTGRFVAAALGTGFPVVATVHGIRFREVVLFGGVKGHLRRRTTIRLEKRVLARLEHVFVIADYVRKAIAELTPARFYPIANPVDPAYFDLATSDREHTVLSVAAVQPRKGLLHLVEAMALVRQEVPEARLRLIGKVLMPDYERQIRNRIGELGLGGAVEMLGFIPDDELREHFTRCSVFALCSVEESSPVSIAEAMALGKPVVATAVGGVPDLVAEGQSGHLVRFGDVTGIAKALCRLLKDDGVRAAFSREARGRAERDFHPEAIARQTAAIYRQIISPEGAGS